MDVLSAIYRYCNYQERCHKEVRSKLYDLGCTTPEVEAYMATLIEKGMLNEQRYANAIVRGKFKMNSWGRNKIVHQLRLNQVSTACITRALKEIDAEDYYETLLKLTERKMAELRSERSTQRKAYKLHRYLLQKGYEYSLVKDAVEEITNRAS
jgi:regulatory protein